MKAYLLFAGINATGRKTHINLEEDLIVLVKKYDSDLSLSSETTQMSRTEVARKVRRVYEIPNQGALYVQVSNHRDIEIADKKVDGLVMCLGFDESTEYFQGLHKEIKQLCNVYNPDRT